MTFRKVPFKGSICAADYDDYLLFLAKNQLKVSEWRYVWVADALLNFRLHETLHVTKGFRLRTDSEAEKIAAQISRVVALKRERLQKETFNRLKAERERAGYR